MTPDGVSQTARIGVPPEKQNTKGKQLNTINIESLLNERAPAYWRRFPGALRRLIVHGLHRLLKIERINNFIVTHHHLRGLRFVDESFAELNCKFSFAYQDLEKIPSSGRLLVVANHPLGGLDGLMILKMLSLVRKDIKIIVTDFLDSINNLGDYFISFQLESGGIYRDAVKKTHAALLDECAVVIFPAGAVSRLKWFSVKDAPWRKSVISLARQYRAPILPVYIDARNSFGFYFLSVLFRSLSMLLLPRELFNKSGKVFSLKIGNVITGRTFAESALNDKVLVKLLKKHVDRMQKNGKPVFLTEEAIIKPAEPAMIEAELRQCSVLVPETGGMVVYEVYAGTCPETMREVGRLREITFRLVGEGKGKRLDIDAYDNRYTHLILFNAVEKEIAGAYRIHAASIQTQPRPEEFYTSELFSFKRAFLDLLPFAAELGRSFIVPKHWKSNALDLLWSGIGAFLSKHSEIRYLFGPVSISAAYHPQALSAVVAFYAKWFSPYEPLVAGKNPFVLSRKNQAFFFELFQGVARSEDYKTLKNYIKQFGHSVPILFRQYAELCEEGGVKFASFNIDRDFGNCVDGFLVLDLEKLKQSKRERYFFASDSSNSFSSVSNENSTHI